MAGNPGPGLAPPGAAPMQAPAPAQAARPGYDPNCVFCKIIGNEIPSKKIYEDDACIAILDIYPAAPGHVIIIPKFHTSIYSQLSADAAKEVGKTMQKLATNLKGAMNSESVTVFIANGAIAGQKAPHVLIHLIPRFKEDGLNFSLPKNELTEEEFTQVRGEIQKYIDNPEQAAPAPAPGQAPAPAPMPAPGQAPAPAPMPEAAPVGQMDAGLLDEINNIVSAPVDQIPAAPEEKSEPPSEAPKEEKEKEKKEDEDIDLDEISKLFG